jgi:hypothetical protein
MTAPPRIVGFMPYAAQPSRSQRLALTLKALAGRGCRVTAVLCDGAFAACDLYPGPAPRPVNACLLCQAGAAGRMAEWALPYRWLGRWIEPGDGARAAAWLAGLKPQDYAEAKLDAWPLGIWTGAGEAAGTAAPETHARRLHSAAVAAMACDRLLDDLRPSLLLTGADDGLCRTAQGVAAARYLPSEACMGDGGVSAETVERACGAIEHRP